MTRLHLSAAVAALPVLALPVLALLLAGSARAAPVLQFKFAHDAVTPGAPRPDQLAQKPAPYRVPEGLPGFYDPRTNTFEPLDLESLAAAATTYSGTVTAAIHIHAESGIGPDDTVFCTLTIEFGNLAGNPPQYFTNHTVSASNNFAAGEPSVDLSVPFDYTPNGNGTAKMRLTLACRIPFASDGTAHSATTTLAVQPLENDGVTASFPMDL